MDFAERDKCKPVLLRLSLAKNLEKPLMSLYGIEWRDCETIVQTRERPHGTIFDIIWPGRKMSRFTCPPASRCVSGWLTYLLIPSKHICVSCTVHLFWGPFGSNHSFAAHPQPPTRKIYPSPPILDNRWTLWAVLGIRVILGPIRIRGSVPLTSGSGSRSDSNIESKDAKKFLIFFFIFSNL